MYLFTFTFTHFHSHKRTNNHSTNSCEIQLGDIQSEEERDIVLELSVPEVEGSLEGAVVRVRLSYFDVISSSFVDDLCTDLVVSRNGMYI